MNKSECWFVDFLRHDVQAYGVPGAPDITHIRYAALCAADYIEMLLQRIAIQERNLARITAQRDHYSTELNNTSMCACLEMGKLKEELNTAKQDMKDMAYNMDTVACEWCKNAPFTATRCKECRIHNEEFEWRGVTPNAKEVSK